VIDSDDKYSYVKPKAKQPTKDPIQVYRAAAGENECTANDGEPVQHTMA
jgi:hypothetical protein